MGTTATKLRARGVEDFLGYEDYTVTVGPSMTDPTGYVPTDELIARITRGELLSSMSGSTYDFDNPAQAMSWIGSEIEARKPNFDLSDIDRILERAAAARKVLLEERNKKLASASNTPAQDGQGKTSESASESSAAAAGASSAAAAGAAA